MRHCCQFYRTPNSSFRAGVTNANAPRNSLVMREVTVWAEWPKAKEVKTGKWEGMCSVSKGSHCPASSSARGLEKRPGSISRGVWGPRASGATLRDGPQPLWALLAFLWGDPCLSLWQEGAARPRNLDLLQ